MKQSIFVAVGMIVIAGFGAFQWASFQQKSPALLEASATAPTEIVILGTATKSFDITAKQWEFVPSIIAVDEGDSVTLNVASTDVTHGLSIPDFGVSETLTPGKTTTVTFTANKAGTFSFFCSIFCGSAHSSMQGTLVVNAAPEPEVAAPPPPEQSNEPETIEPEEPEIEVAAPQETTPIKTMTNTNRSVTTTPVPADDVVDAQEDVSTGFTTESPSSASTEPSIGGEPLSSITTDTEETPVQGVGSSAATSSAVAIEPPTLDLVKVGAKTYTVASDASGANAVPELRTATSETQSSTTVNATPANVETLAFQQTEPITFSGTTLPNATVTLEIRSNPITATTQSNSKGIWEYTLDQTLDAGEHTLKVAVADASGNASEQSDPLTFVVQEASQDGEAPDNASLSMLALVGIALGAGLLIIFFILVFKLRRSAS